MTTFSYTLELDDGERSTLGTALAMLKDDCLEQMETTPGTPYKKLPPSLPPAVSPTSK